jgi:hypothetical protein
MEDFKNTWNRMEKNVDDAELGFGDLCNKAIYGRHLYNTVCKLYEKVMDKNDANAYTLFSTLRTKAAGLFSKDFLNIPKEMLYPKLLALEPMMIACGELCDVEVLRFEDAFIKRTKEIASKPYTGPI